MRGYHRGLGVTEQQKEALGTLWAKAIAGTFEHLRKFLAVYFVMFAGFGGVATATWSLILRPALAAEMQIELANQLNAPCLRDEDGNRETTLACRIEAAAEADIKAIEDLSEKLSAYQAATGTNQTIIQSDQASIKAEQREIREQLERVLFLLEKAYPVE